MRAHDHAVAASEKRLDHLVGTDIENAVFLPGRSEQHHRAGMLGLFATGIFRDLAVDQVVAAFHKRARP
ncbi:MAG: hypothetical protein Q4B69_08405, partial [Slackia sp.]|nr:hypothetical protein [Slackia sp.]